VNAQPDHSAEVKFKLPASAVGLQAECMPIDSTGSNPEDHVGFPSASPVAPVSDVQLMRPVTDGISALISQAGEPSSRIVRADTEMSVSNHDRRPDDDSLVYHPCDEGIYSTVRVEQTHSDVSVSHHESCNDVRASNNEVRGVWIRRAKGRVSSTTTKFVYSCILRGSTASSRSTVSYLPVKSNSGAPRKFDYMTVPHLTQFIKKDQIVPEDPNRFDLTTAEPENEDELPDDASESSADSQKSGKVPFPRSNLAKEIRRIGMDQSASRILGQAATAPIDQSELSACATSDQSEATKARPVCYEGNCRTQFVSRVLASTESTTFTVGTTDFRSNSIDFLESCTRPYSSSFLRSVLTNLICLVWSSRRILRRKTKQHKCRRYRLIRAICAVIGLCSSPTIAAIHCSITESPGMVFLWFIRMLMLGMANTNEDRDLEPDSDD